MYKEVQCGWYLNLYVRFFSYTKHFVNAVGLFQKIILNTIQCVLNNMTQMLQVSKNSNIKYNIIQIN